MHFNVFDYVVLGIMVLSCLFAFYRGLVREILSLIAWIGAGVVTVLYFHDVAEKLAPHFKSPTVAAAIATIGLYVAALIVFGIVNIIIVKSIRSSGEKGTLDNMLGLAFGAVRGALIVSLGFFLITMAIPDKEYPEWIANAATKPYVEKGAIMLVKAAPDYMRELSTLQKKTTEEIQAHKKSSDNTTEQGDSENGSGYNRTSNRQLDRLIDSTADQPAR